MLRDRESTWASPQDVWSEKLSLTTFDIDILGVGGGYYYVGLRTLNTCLIPSYPIPGHRAGATPECGHSKSELSVEGLIEVATCIDEHDLVACLVEWGLQVVFWPNLTFAFRRGPSEGSFDFQILLIQHSSGKPHPSAAKPAFSVFKSSDLLMQIFLRMQVVGENLVLAVELPFKRIYFFNWQTGESKGVRWLLTSCNDINPWFL